MKLHDIPGMSWATTVSRTRRRVSDLPEDAQREVLKQARISMACKAGQFALAVPAMILTSPLLATALTFELVGWLYTQFDRIAGPVSEVAFYPANKFSQLAQRAISRGNQKIQEHRPLGQGGSQ